MKNIKELLVNYIAKPALSGFVFIFACFVAVYAASITQVKTQTISSGDTMSASWFQDVNDMLKGFLNGEIRSIPTYSYDKSSKTSTFSNTGLGRGNITDVQTTIKVQKGDIVKVNLACNLQNSSGATSYMNVILKSGSASIKLQPNRITTSGGGVGMRVGGSSIGIYKANVDGNLTFTASAHVGSGTGSAVYCNIIAYVIGRE